MNRNKLLLRSFMFLPAYNTRFIDKALASDADALILDLEDSVPLAQKEEARLIIKEYQSSGRLADKIIFVRVNELATEDFQKDIFQMILPDINGFMLSKIRNEEEIRKVDSLLDEMESEHKMESGHFLLAPLIETTEAVMRIREIALSSKRLVALCFGGEDYLNDLGSTYTYQTSAFEYPRSVIANAARMAGLLPIDTPYLEINDLEGFIKIEKEMYKRGFAGCLLLNPKQIEAANEAFSPTKEELDYSLNIIDAISQSMAEKKSGVAMYNGAMVGPPMKKRAYRVKELQDLIESKRKEKQ